MPKRSAVRLTLAAVAAALLLAACSDQVPLLETPTASTTATPMPALTLGPAIELPPDVALLLETGCFQCDGPATGLIRVSRSAQRVSQRDLLVSAGAHVLYGGETGPPQFFAGDLPIHRETIETEKGQEQYEPYVTGIAASTDGAEIVVSVCVYPGCGVGMDAWSEDGRVTLYRSSDGGDTWAEFGAIDGGAVLGIVSPGTILALSPVGPDGPPDVFLYPGHELVDRPPSTQGVFPAPMVLADGTIAWPNWGGTLQRPDGSVIVQLPAVAGVNGPWSIGPAVQQPFGDRSVAVLWTAANLPGSTTFLSLFQADGTHLRTVTFDRSVVGGGVAWVSDTALIANVSVTAEELPKPPPEFFPGLLPALIDVEAGTISPIVFPFLEEGAEAGRDYVRGVQRLQATE